MANHHAARLRYMAVFINKIHACMHTYLEGAGGNGTAEFPYVESVRKELQKSPYPSCLYPSSSLKFLFGLFILLVVLKTRF